MIKRAWHLYITGNLFLIFLFSCSPAPRVVLDTERVSPVELVQNVRNNHLKKTSLVARGSLSIETQDFANSGRFTMNLQHPDSLMINLRGPLGINVGTVFLSQSLFLFYNGLANRVILGEPRTDIFRTFLHFDFDVNDVMDLFLGGTRELFDEKRIPDEFMVDGDQYLLVFRSENSIRRYWIDPLHNVVTRKLLSDRSNVPLIEQRFDRFIHSEGVVIPRSVRVISYTEEARFSFVYDRIEVNPRVLSFAYSIPQSAEVIYW